MMQRARYVGPNAALKGDTMLVRPGGTGGWLCQFDDLEKHGQLARLQGRTQLAVGWHWFRREEVELLPDS